MVGTIENKIEFSNFRYKVLWFSTFSSKIEYLTFFSLDDFVPFQIHGDQEKDLSWKHMN